MTTHPSSPQPSAARSTPALRPGRRQRLLQQGLGLMLLASLHACGGSSVDDPASPDGNTAPVARIADIASPQSVGQAIALSGAPSSDADGDALSYRWSLGAAPGGSSPTIADPQAQTTTLRSDLPGDYQVVLLVNDGSTDSGSAVAAFTLTNTAPTANAGPDAAVDLYASAELDGSGSSDIDGQALSYLWTVVETPTGSAAALSADNDVRPTLSPMDLPGDYRISLVVSDGLESSAPDEVTVSTNNLAPVANAGADIGGKQVGNRVTLDGSASVDVDGDPLSYGWSFVSKPEGSSATLDNAGLSMPSFTIDKKGDYRLDLVVSDGQLESEADSVNVNAGNTAPVANAGADKSGSVGTSISLSAAGSSDVDGDALTFLWSLSSKPAGSAATLTTPNQLSTGFTPDLAGNYVAQVAVSDGSANTTDSVAVSVSPANSNRAPLADAGPDQSFEDASLPLQINLDGSGSSDPDGDALIYAWSLTPPTGSSASLLGASSATPSFEADIGGIYTAQLIVNDGQTSSTPDTVNVTLGGNGRPEAKAGADQSIILGQTASLNGSGSTDPDGDTLSYAWSVTSTPAGATASFDSATKARPKLSVDAIGSYLVQLIVSDGQLDSTPDTMTLNVADGDQDGDGLQSSFEIANDLDPNKADSDGDGVNDGAEDGDSDGLDNGLEAEMGYDIGSSDSDGDGITDGDEDFDGDGFGNASEIAAGTDPTLASDYPRESLVGETLTFDIKQSPVVPGGLLNYVITVANTSATEQMSNVQVKLTVPKGVYFDRDDDAFPDVTGGCGTYDCAEGQQAYWNFGTAAPGDSITINVEANVASDVTVGETISTEISLFTSELQDPIALSEAVVVVAQQPVQLVLSASKDPVAPGESFTYTLDLGNSGTTTVNNTALSLSLPAGLTVDAISNGGTQSGQTVSWTIGSLASTASLARTVTVTLDPDAAEATTLTAIAQLRHDGGLELDRELYSSISVSQPLPLSISYELGQTPVTPGGHLDYAITISNSTLGTTVQNVYVRMRMPKWITFDRDDDAFPDVTGGCGTYTCAEGQEVYWNLGTLAPGSSVPITIVADVDAGADPGALIETLVFVSATGLGDSVQLSRVAPIAND